MTQADFLDRVSRYDGGMYGGLVGTLSGAERDLALSLRADDCTAATVGREILRARGLYPSDPDPRRRYGRFMGARGLPMTDGFGRPRRRRR